MEKQDQERVNAAFQQGVKDFTVDDLNKVLDDESTARKKASFLGKQLDNFLLLWDLLKDYHNGIYKNVPWKLIAAVGFAVAYLISPLDVIPDVIPVLGFVDDAAVFALVVSAFQSVIDAYKEWKKNN